MKAEGMEMQASDIGMSMTLLLEDGGTGTAATGDQTEPLQWTLDGAKLTVIVAEDPMVFDVTAEALISEEMDGMVMTFTREQPEAVFVPAKPVEATDISQFEGLWHSRTPPAF